MGVNTLGPDETLKSCQVTAVLPDFPWQQFPAADVTHQHPYRLTDAPFHRMEPVTAIAQMCGADILVCRQQVVHADGEQGS